MHNKTRSDIVVDAIRSLVGDEPGFGFEDDGTITSWSSSEDIPQPTETDITTEIVRLQAEYDAEQYARDRAEAYPPMADQLDDIFHNGVAGWKKTIQAVKDTYPKP